MKNLLNIKVEVFFSIISDKYLYDLRSELKEYYTSKTPRYTCINKRYFIKKVSPKKYRTRHGRLKHYTV